MADYLKGAEPEQLNRRVSAEAKAIQEERDRQLKRKALLANVKREQERAAARKRAYAQDPRNIAKTSHKAAKIKM